MVPNSRSFLTALVKGREEEWEESRRGRRAGRSDRVFKRFEVSTCGMGQGGGGVGAYKMGIDLFQSE